MGTKVFSSGLKQLVHEAKHSPPSSAKVSDVWSYAPRLLGMVLN
jgi:hypothetical protein